MLQHEAVPDEVLLGVLFRDGEGNEHIPQAERIHPALDEIEFPHHLLRLRNGDGISVDKTHPVASLPVHETAGIVERHDRDDDENRNQDHEALLIAAEQMDHLGKFRD